jgi:hypothetical protein
MNNKNMKHTAMAAAVCLFAGFILGFTIRGLNKEQPQAASPTFSFETEPAPQTYSRPVKVPADGEPAITRDERRDRTETRTAIDSKHNGEATAILSGDVVNRSPRAGFSGRTDVDRHSTRDTDKTLIPEKIEQSHILIPRRLIPKLSVPVMDEKYRLGEDIAEVLGITPREKEQIENAFIDARSLLDELEAKHSTVLSRTTSTVEITISPFESDGQMIESNLMTRIRATLGDERFDYFASLTRYSFEEKFNRFGKASQNVKVTTNNYGRLSFEVVWSITNDQHQASGSRGSSSTTFHGIRSIPENYIHLFKAD